MHDIQDEPIYFKEWRIFADLTQAELGELIGRIETGRRDFDGKYLKAFKAAINKALEHHPLRSAATQIRISRMYEPLCVKPDPNLWLDLDLQLQLQAEVRRAVASIAREKIEREQEGATG